MTTWKSCALSLACAAVLATAPAQAAGTWVRTWAAPPVEALAPKAGAPDAGLSDVTLRMPVRISAGGTSLRLRLSNELTDRPLPIGAVHVAIADAAGAAVAGSDRVVTFAGAASPTIPPYAPLQSDPVALTVPALAKLIVSIHIPGDAGGITTHSLGVANTTILPGDQTASTGAGGGRSAGSRYVLSGIDVTGGPATATIATFGDSITDGALSTWNANHRWPDLLAERLKAAGRAKFAVANVGISGNRLLQTGAGPAALARLDRDVFSVAGVRYLVVLEGINDIGFTKNAHLPPPRPAELIAAYRQIIDRAHDRGIKVIGATILPYKGAGYRSPEGDEVRQAVNAWIRRRGNFDGVIDFERATADPGDPLAMRKQYDSGDHLHPNDAGYAAMAQAVDLSLFK